MSLPLKVLILEDRLEDAALVLHALQKAGFALVWQRVATQEDYLASLSSELDLILADYSLPQFTGIRALQLLQERGLDTPFIIVSGAIDDEAAVEAMRQGASDYIHKDRLVRLGSAVTHALEQKRLRDEKRQTEAALNRRDAILEAVAFAGERLLRASPWEETINDVLERLGMAVGVSRVGILEKRVGDDGHNYAVWRYVWAADGIEGLSDTAESYHMPFHDGTYSRWGRMLLSGQLIGGKTSTFPSEERQILESGGVKSILIVPIFTGNLIWGAISFQDNVIEREWLPVELDTIITAASTLGAALQRVQSELTLRDSEEKFRSIIEQSSDGILMTDEVGKVIKCNPAMERISGLAAADMLGRPIWDVIPLAIKDFSSEDSSTSHLEAEVIELLHSGETGRIGQVHDHEFKNREGSLRLIQHVVFPIRIDQGFMACSFMRDVTEQKQRDREREAIIKVSSALRAISTRTAMLPVLLEQACGLINGTGASIELVDPISGDLVIELGHKNLEKFTGIRIPKDQEGISWQVINSGKVYLNADVMADARKLQPELVIQKAVAVVPLIAQEKTIGCLWVNRETEFTNSEVNILAAIGDMAANAILRETLHEQTVRGMQRLAALHAIDIMINTSLDLNLTLNLLMQQVTVQLGVDAVDVLLVDPQTGWLNYAAGRGFVVGDDTHQPLNPKSVFAGKASAERHLVTIPDLRQIKLEEGEFYGLEAEKFISYYGVPLISKGEVKGVLEIFHRSALQAVPDWLDFLEALAAQAAIAIDNAQLFTGMQRTNAELAQAYDATIEGWSRALDLRDEETEFHTQRVTSLTIGLARALGIAEDELVQIRRGALLHDIGKMGIPDRILLKTGPLNDNEWMVMRNHPVYAYELISPIAFLRPALDIPYCHHEKWDGSGYPRKLRGEEIPLAARVFAIIDVWDALLSDRPYRLAWEKDRALQYIVEQSGTHFDPKIVALFLEFIKNWDVDADQSLEPSPANPFPEEKTNKKD
ncbi:MAG: GAF domain-containing protein [Anaerolineaceae bacterium]|nr:GAF domain-containing protein [Anaerolineaceae bacterium]